MVERAKTRGLLLHSSIGLRKFIINISDRKVKVRSVKDSINHTDQQVCVDALRLLTFRVKAEPGLHRVD